MKIVQCNRIGFGFIFIWFGCHVAPQSRTKQIRSWGMRGSAQDVPGLPGSSDPSAGGENELRRMDGEESSPVPADPTLRPLGLLLAGGKGHADLIDFHRRLMAGLEDSGDAGDGLGKSFDSIGHDTIERALQPSIGASSDAITSVAKLRLRATNEENGTNILGKADENISMRGRVQDREGHVIDTPDAKIPGNVHLGFQPAPAPFSFAGKPEEVMLCFGDSLTWGMAHNYTGRYDVTWPMLLQKKVERFNVKVLESALCSRTTVFDDDSNESWMPGAEGHDFNGLDHFVPEFLSACPGWLIILLGTNDLKGRIREKSKYRTRLDASIVTKNCASIGLKARELHEKSPFMQGALKIALIVPPEIVLNRLSTELGYDSSSARISQDFREAFKKVCMDHHFYFVEAEIDMENSMDGIHITEAANRSVARAVYKMFRQAAAGTNPEELIEPEGETEEEKSFSDNSISSSEEFSTEDEEDLSGSESEAFEIDEDDDKKTGGEKIDKKPSGKQREGEKIMKVWCDEASDHTSDGTMEEEAKRIPICTRKLKLSGKRPKKRFVSNGIEIKERKGSGFERPRKQLKGSFGVKTSPRKKKNKEKKGGNEFEENVSSTLKDRTSSAKKGFPLPFEDLIPTLAKGGAAQLFGKKLIGRSSKTDRRKQKQPVDPRLAAEKRMIKLLARCSKAATKSEFGAFITDVLAMQGMSARQVIRRMECLKIRVKRMRSNRVSEEFNAIMNRKIQEQDELEELTSSEEVEDKDRGSVVITKMTKRRKGNKERPVVISLDSDPDDVVVEVKKDSNESSSVKRKKINRTAAVIELLDDDDW